jgi:hypothetical protein
VPTNLALEARRDRTKIALAKSNVRLAEQRAALADVAQRRSFDGRFHAAARELLDTEIYQAISKRATALFRP